MEGDEKGVSTMASIAQDGTSDWNEDLYEDVLETIEDRLLEIEDLIDVSKADETRVQAYAEIRRVTHSLKGLAQAYGLEDIAAGCHNFEDRFEASEGVDHAQLRIFITKLQQMLEQHLTS